MGYSESIPVSQSNPLIPAISHKYTLYSHSLAWLLKTGRRISQDGRLPNRYRSVLRQQGQPT